MVRKLFSTIFLIIAILLTFGIIKGYYPLRQFLVFGATSYYVDFTGGDDSGTGAIEDPWKHCPGMPEYSGGGSLSSGDTVYFDRADTWLIDPGANNYLLSATAGVTYIGNSWGTGTRAKFKLNGDIPTINWPIISILVSNVTFQGFEIDGASYDGDGIGIGDPTETASISNILVDDCVVHNIGSQDGNVYIGIRVGAGPSGYDTDSVTVQYCVVYSTDGAGMMAYGDNAADSLITNLIFQYNILYDCNDNTGLSNQAMCFKNGVQGGIMQGNLLYNNNKGAVEISSTDGTIGPTSCTVRWNNMRDSLTQNGISFVTRANSSADIYGNVIENNAMEALRFSPNQLNAATVNFYGNTCDKNSTGGGANGEIWVKDGGGTIALTLKNNIFFARAGETVIDNDESNCTMTASNNHYHRADGDANTLVDDNSTIYTSANITDFDANGQTGDPGFIDEANDDFRLSSSSSCIDAGANLGSPYDNGLSERSIWPSSVGTKDQDDFDAIAGGGVWEIGAYVKGREFWQYGLSRDFDFTEWHAGSDVVIKGDKMGWKATGANAWAVSPVVDTGRHTNNLGYFGFGGNISLTKKIRGSTSSFAWDAGSPSWETFAPGVNKNWRFIQLRFEKP